MKTRLYTEEYWESRNRSNVEHEEQYFIDQ